MKKNINLIAYCDKCGSETRHKHHSFVKSKGFSYINHYKCLECGSLVEVSRHKNDKLDDSNPKYTEKGEKVFSVSFRKYINNCKTQEIVLQKKEGYSG